MSTKTAVHLLIFAILAVPAFIVLFILGCIEDYRSL